MSSYQPGPGESRLGKQLKIISRHLDTDGDGTGTKNAIGDYSATPEIFYIQPPAGEIYRITRMMVLIRGAKSTFYTDSYGSRTELSTGVEIRTQDDSGTIVNLTDNVPIKTNGNWGRFCYDSEVYAADQGNTNTYLRVRWTFEKSGQQIRLVGNNNERLEVVLNDNFSLASGGGNNALVEHYFVVQGFEEDPAEE